ncbi:MAG: COX15/CtaA family protein [Pyrinomonadaceae bacterium]
MDATSHERLIGATPIAANIAEGFTTKEAAMSAALRYGRFSTYAWATLAYNLAVVAWGAYVRATSSGAGCGSHWPLCNGEMIPRAPRIETVIELTHRLSSGLALLFVVGLFLWARKIYMARHPARRAAGYAILFMFAEALIGAGLVLFRLVAHNDSMARAAYLSVHLVNTFLLLAAIALAAWWASGGKPVRFRGQERIVQVFSICAVLAMLVLGVSGAVTALGDTLFPSASLAAGFKQDLEPAAHFLIRLRVFHPVIAIAVGLLLVAFADYSIRRRAASDARTKRLASMLVYLVAAQLAIGAFNVGLLAPLALQLVHLVFADLMWIALVLLIAAMLAAKPDGRPADVLAVAA